MDNPSLSRTTKVHLLWLSMPLRWSTADCRLYAPSQPAVSHGIRSLYHRHTCVVWYCFLICDTNVHLMHDIVLPSPVSFACCQCDIVSTVAVRWKRVDWWPVSHSPHPLPVVGGVVVSSVLRLFCFSNVLARW